MVGAQVSELLHGTELVMVTPLSTLIRMEVKRKKKSFLLCSATVWGLSQKIAYPDQQHHLSK